MTRILYWLAPVSLALALSGCADADAPIDTTSAGAGQGGMSSGAAGAGGTRVPAGSSGDAGASGGASSLSGSSGAAGAAPEPEVEPGETGIFMGMTAAHNRARASVDSATPLEDLAWSEELAEVAQDWSDNLAARCGTIEHRQPNPYGENIAMRSSSRLLEPFAPEEAVAGWMAEEACWDFGTIQGTESCDSACVGALNSTGCGHYTQIIWRSTERVGCGYSTCELGNGTAEIWVCNYDPPGNFIGRAPY